MLDLGLFLVLIGGLVYIFYYIIPRKFNQAESESPVQPARNPPETKNDKQNLTQASPGHIPDKFEEFATLMAEDVTEGWDVVKDTPDLKVYKKITESSPVAIIKATIIVQNTTADDALFAIWDGEFRREWDDVLQDFKVIEKYSETSDVIYFYAASPVPTIVSNREFVQYRKYRKDGKGILIVYWSADKEDLPIPEGWVRANTIISGYYIKPIENGVEMYFISQNDVRGKIPPKLINAVAPTKAMEWSKKFKKACALLKKRR
ncbi:hypothetical protein SteCoe_34391 [Stentor coeruleus]|uniref:START domain-containing protein n=1 Tax=Stentor coeruleus TaxID=5963 RepID=A0A1R2AUP5_9CILI|nr:hypothetical protein SteCoe_34391 [Stentor coeruleus]